MRFWRTTSIADTIKLADFGGARHTYSGDLLNPNDFIYDSTTDGYRPPVCLPDNNVPILD